MSSLPLCPRAAAQARLPSQAAQADAETAELMAWLLEDNSGSSGAERSMSIGSLGFMSAGP